MNRWFTSLSVALTATLLVTSIHPQPVQSADAVFCTNCGTEWTQLMNKAMMVKQLANQAQQLKAEIGQYQDMLTNSKTIPSQLWGRAMQDFQQLTNVMQRSRAIAYSASNLDGQFASRYGSYNSYLSRKMGNNDWQNKYAQWSREGTDNTLYAMKGLGVQAAQMQDDQALMQRLQSMASSAEGRMQAIQVGNMMAAQNVDQVMKLRQLMMMQLQMQANYMAVQQDQDAARQASREKLYKTWKDTPNNNGKGY
jgi:P-type conjugative transfer protein TrbJ